MSTAYNPIAPISLPYPEPVTALAFDPVSDILWTGSNAGRVSALCSPRGLRGVSYPVGTLAIQKIYTGENYVRTSSLSGEGVGSWTKGGMNKWFYKSPSSVTTFSSSSHSVAVATSAQDLILLNSVTGSVMRQAPSASLITHMEFSHTTILTGSSDGIVRTHDSRTGLVANGETSARAHYSGFLGLQASGNFLYTIGLSTRQNRPYPDPLVKVYDLRNMKSLPPIPFSSNPAFINLVPKKSSNIIISSNQGLINIVDVTNPNAPGEFYQLDITSYLTSVAISPTGAYMACGDAEGTIHLLSQIQDDEGIAHPFNGFDGQPIEWADPPERLPDMDWEAPLNTVGMPHYTTRLLSAWTTQFEPPTAYFPAPQKIPVQVLQTMKMNDNVAYAALPKELKGRRNMAPTAPKKEGGHFRSGKSRGNDPDPNASNSGDIMDEVPKSYRRVEIEYSKFGVEDFDFGFYNKTEFSGLETHILNSYTNAIVQTMHYNKSIRKLTKSHITTNCSREWCLLCEMGFITRMLEDAHGTNCQASNFCKTVGVIARMSNSIDIVDYGREPTEVDYGHMIQSFHRFLLEHFASSGDANPQNPVIVRHSDYNPDNPVPAPMVQLFGIDAKNVVTCMNCGAVREKENMTHVVDLSYPRYSEDSAYGFSSILERSLLRQMSYKSGCQVCHHSSTFISQRSIATRDLPPILAINAGVHSEESMKFWSDQRGRALFLTPQIEVHGQKDGIDDSEVTSYELRTVVVQVVEKDGYRHLVSIIKVPEAEERHPEESPWYLFNDFSVQNISEEDALSFPGMWKIPAVLHFERVDMREQLDFSGLPHQMDTSILNRDTSISFNRDPSLIKHECLGYDELPTPGTLVAIDAEFVSMQQEEIEYRSDGSNKVLRPARLSLARVSVLRGDGLKQGVPFIDEHIHTSEAIVDYLTEFSGIRFGDLDIHHSPYTLTPLKVAYKKLRLLVDSGCVFIGHGLSKDFRIINIYVPPEQVIDTVDLYFLNSRGRRRLSLRFLSWFVLHENIQTDTHDSIEDARSALNLYKAALVFEEEGAFDRKLEEIYKEGRQYNFKPPPPPDAITTAPTDQSLITPLGVPFNAEQANAFIDSLYGNVRPNTNLFSTYSIPSHHKDRHVYPSSKSRRHRQM